MGPLQTTLYIGLAIGAGSMCIQLLRRDKDAPVIVKRITPQEALSKQHARDYTRALPVEPVEVPPVANDAVEVPPVVTTPPPVKIDVSLIEDAISALRNLGLTKTKATKIVNFTYKTFDNEPSLSELITASIKTLTP